ncbi:C-terminal four TMM region of protein-O-mannosyltransferase [Nocardioides exalbidus]|uniref:Polyprenol-phosphate-mannose--protein mannosyltransferase n=1 Tax=Nocardioides exalbidus TaxID=402596 RepID=A0A1H4KXQ5_9ACTN|nr:phospholipid carrier-dependent glycosyltransferase [Nocardioides exalbidus]SEB63261.1 C-terminal four TMM region of protein-O-mannosyltransferase [Nocardioides exalbidus]
MTPTAAERNRPRWRSEDPALGWVGAICLAALAFFLRRWHLGTPHQFSFDETYYAKDAWSLLNHGYVLGYVDDADKTILNGNVMGLWKDDPSMIVHPEVGKWLIALGIKAWGMDPTGWRMASAIVGSLMVLVMCRFVRRVTGSTVIGLVAGLLISIDGLQLVLSRLALLDIFLAFFILCGVHCVVADRQWLRDRLASGRHGRALGLWRPWLLLGGLMFGLACGTKWSAAYTLAVFGLLAWLWSAGARRAFGQRRPLLRSILLDGAPAFLALVGVALVTYVASWTGWLIHADAYEQTLSNTQYTTYEGGKQWPTATEPDAEGLGEVTQSLRSLWHYHHDVYVFHSHFLNDSTHIYASKPSTWLVMGRPVGVDAQTDIQPGSQGCDAASGSTCIRQILLLGNPVIWWGGCLAMIASLLLWIGARDWRHGVAVVGLASTWLPWFLYDDRPIFFFYAIACLPFMVLSIALAMGHLLGSSDEPTPRRTFGVVVAGSYTVLALIAFAWFWPIWTDVLLTKSEWDARIWFRRWI